MTANFQFSPLWHDVSPGNMINLRVCTKVGYFAHWIGLSICMGGNGVA